MTTLPAVFTFPRGILPQWAKDAGLRLPSPMRHADASATPLTPEQIRAEFLAYGVTVTSWCRERGFHRLVVVDLLRGKRVGIRGDAHRAAVALGMKPDPRTRQINHPFEQPRKCA